jgi:hypothetical protein
LNSSCSGPWLRRTVADAQSLAAQGARPNAIEDVALAAGAAIGALDAVVCRQERWAGAWRQRLALSAAALAARQAGRVEDAVEVVHHVQRGGRCAEGAHGQPR